MMTRVSGIISVIAAIPPLSFTTVAAMAAPAVYNAHLSGNEQVPARATHATGQAIFKLNADRTELQFRINVSNIENVVSARLHLAPAGQTGPEIAVLFGPVAPGGGKSAGTLVTGALAATNLTGDMAGKTLADLAAEIEAGRVYVNIATDDGVGQPDEKPGDFSAGEIRGQIR
ncbi:MAG TPA: CHRD domain-containing protein [Candidatus Eisenbacteria bacterium]